MLRLSTVLLVILSHTLYAQEVIGTIAPPFEVEDTEISFAGDTMLVRLVSKSGPKVSEAAWYGPSGKISDADVTAFGKASIMGIVAHGDSLLYYVNQDGKTNEVGVYSSIGLGAIQSITSIPIAGSALRGFQRGADFLVITWEQKTQVVHFYTIRSSKLISEQQLQLDKELLTFKPIDITFPVAGEPNRISVMKTTLRFFLNGDTFAAVYDMPGSLYPQEVARYKTRVVRLNLSTNEKSDVSVYSYKNFAFKSFLVGSNRLYRMAISKDSCKINIHDLDNRGKLIGSYPVPSLGKEKLAIHREGSKHKIEYATLRGWGGLRATPGYDIGIVVDDYGNEQAISLGLVVSVKGGIAPIGTFVSPLVGIFTSILFTAVMQSRNDPADIRYVYLKGTPASGYKLLGNDELGNFLKGRLDKFEFDIQTKGDVDYLSYFANKNYCISISKFDKSSYYSITKFPL